MLTVVTGAYGHVGANLVRALLDRGDRVRVADRRQTKALAGLDVEHRAIDVLQPSSLEKAFTSDDGGAGELRESLGPIGVRHQIGGSDLLQQSLQLAPGRPGSTRCRKLRPYSR